MNGILFEDPNEFATIGQTERLVAESIKRIVMTSPNERPNNLGFGFGIKNYLFYEQSALQGQFKQALITQVQKEEPRILVKEVLYQQNGNKMLIRFQYIIREFYLDEHTLDIEIGV